MFLASILQLRHPQYGFTPLLGLYEIAHPGETPALQAIPHFDHPGGQGYDGGYYVQLALDPLLSDPATDRALDHPAYRARRILFSWTAYAAGFGRPAWIVRAYALQNLVFWLALAWLMTRWLNPVDPRRFALWLAVMFGPGMIASTRLALLDGPSMCLLAAAMALSERGRLWASAGVLGLAGLGRETNVLGAVGLPSQMTPRGMVRLLGALLVVALPLLVWQDYIYAIYRGASTVAGAEHITPPLVAYGRKWQSTLVDAGRLGAWSHAGATLLVIVALTSQAAYLVWTREWREPWWRLAAAFAVLMLVVDDAVWEGHPGAIVRVVLPLTFGFNVLLRRATVRFWPWYVAGNLHLVTAAISLPAPW